MKIRPKMIPIIIVLVMTLLLSTMADSSRAYASTNVGYGGASFSDAKSLSLGQEYKGTASGDNYHYFKFRTTGNKNVRYKFRTINYSNITGFISFRVLDYDGNSIEFFSVHTGGEPETALFSTLKPNRTYYLKVGNLRLADDDFSLKITQSVPKPAKASIKTIKSGKKRLTIKYRAVKNATKYEVQYRKSGSSKWNKKMTRNTNVTIRGLKRGAKYQVRVRAIRVVGGKNYAGSFSPKKAKRVK